MKRGADDEIKWNVFGPRGSKVQVMVMWVGQTVRRKGSGAEAG